MATTIPANLGKPSAPQFKLTGEKIISESTDSFLSTTLTSSTIPAWVAKSDNTFTQQDIIVMSQSVTIEISDPDGNTIPTYDTTGDFVGGTPVNGQEIGSTFEIYYTLNGKDPKRTKAYLYTGAFTLSDNVSGSDNSIIKARSYKNGVWSDVSKIELRIAKNIVSTNSD